MSKLPAGWAIEELGELTTKIVDGSHNPPPGVDVGEPMLSARNIEGGRINFDKYRLITSEAFEREDARTAVAPDDVLLTIVGTIGRSAVVPLDHPRFSLQRSVAVLRPNGSITPHYLRHYLQADDTQQWMLERAKGTAQKGIYLGALAKLPCLVPPLAEQRQIVAKLDALTVRTARARADLDRIPALAARYKQAALAKAFSEAEAEAVETRTLGAVSEEVRNGLSRRPEHAPPGLPILKISAIRPLTVRLEEVRYYVLEPGEDVERYALKSGDLLFTRFNGNPELVAACGRVRELPDEGMLYPDKLIRVRLDQDRVAPEFAEIVASSPQAREQLEQNIKSAAGQHGISGGDLKLLRMPLPSVDSQRVIARRTATALREIDRLISEAVAARHLLNRLDQAVLAKAFRGDLVLQDPDDEPASVLLDRIRAERATAPKAKRGRRVAA